MALCREFSCFNKVDSDRCSQHQKSKDATTIQDLQDYIVIRFNKIDKAIPTDTTFGILNNRLEVFLSELRALDKKITPVSEGKIRMGCETCAVVITYEYQDPNIHKIPDPYCIGCGVQRLVPVA